MEENRYMGKRRRGEIHARRMTEATGWEWRYMGQRSRDRWGEIHARRMTEATGWEWRYIGTGGGCVALAADVIGVGSLIITDGWGEDVPNAGGLHCLHRLTRDASGVVDRNGSREFPNRRALVAYIAGGVEWVGGSWF